MRNERESLLHQGVSQQPTDEVELTDCAVAIEMASRICGSDAMCTDVLKMCRGGLNAHTRVQARCAVSVEGLRFATEDSTPLLHGIDTSFQPEKLTALMGPSGAGKSTLLEVVAGRRARGALCGRVAYNGQPLTAAMRHCIAFVHQYDEALPTLTVHETLAYAAALRMPDKASQRREAVVEMLVRLRLTACADTPVGSISGGERKRLSIGVELIHQVLEFDKNVAPGLFSSDGVRARRRCGSCPISPSAVGSVAVGNAPRTLTAAFVSSCSSSASHPCFSSTSRRRGSTRPRRMPS